MISKTRNPKRVAAGRLNRLKRKPLTDSALERLRTAALENKPWQHSTGPRTEAGKQRISEATRKRRSMPTPPPDWIQHASQVQKNIAKLRRSCHIDLDAMKLMESSSVAQLIQELIPVVNRQFSQEMASRLVGLPALGPGQ